MKGNAIRTGAVVAIIAGVGGLAGLLGAGDAAASTPACNSHQNVVAAVETDSAAATICQWQGDGKLEYHGVTKASGNQIIVPVTAVREQANHPGLYSYTAVNAGYTYRVDDKTALTIIDPRGAMAFYERQI